MILPGRRSEFNEPAYIGYTSDVNIHAARNVQMLSEVGTGDGDVVLTLRDIGWAKKIMFRASADGLLQVSLTGEDADWTSGGLTIRRLDAKGSTEFYPMTTVGGDFDPNKMYIVGDNGPFAPFFRFVQDGGTPLEVDVFIQG